MICQKRYGNLNLKNDTQLKNFKLYSSSAGSGKTFTLARSFLQLTVRNPSLYKSILAVTFTNKAAWEMKSRIMLYLHQLATGRDCPVLEPLIEETGLSEEKIRANAGAALSNILHNYPLFSVKTIDSFFQNVVQAFAKELGLQGGFEIELDEEKVLNDLVDRMMLDAGQNKDLTEWLIRFTEARLSEGKSWDIREEIKKLAWEIFNEHFKIFGLDIRKKKRAVPDLLKEVSAIATKFENELASLGKKAWSMAKAKNLTLQDFSYGSTGAMGYLQKLAQGYIGAPGVRFVKAVSAPEDLVKKKDPNRDAIIALYEAGLKDIMNRTLEMFERDYPVYLSALAIKRYIYTLGILSDIAFKLQDYREDNQVLLISDLADFLKRIIAENEAPFIYEKTGSRFRHFMIDECQDTSGFQWNNFKPLILNSLAEGGLNLAVGDVKQSIYRWRGGDWELLLSRIQEDIGENNVEKLNLDANRRSKAALIRFFNAVFTKAPQALRELFLKSISNLEAPLKDILMGEANKITEAYADSLQRIPEHRLQNPDEGYVRVAFYEDEEDLPWEEKVLDSIPGILERLQDHGYRLRDVAFIVRRREEGEQIVNYLLQFRQSEKAKDGYRYEAISSESLFLGAAHSVKLLLALFQYLYKPDNPISIFNAVYIYQRYILNNTGFDHPDIISQAARVEFIREKGLAPASFFQEKEFLKALPLYEMLEKLIRMFSLQEIKGEWVFLQAFLDAILDFSQKERGDLAKFLSWWETTGSKRSIQLPDEVDAARVLTIHKSKGLQFKVVIIPFCNWDFEPNAFFDNIIWATPTRAPFNILNRLPVKYASNLAASLFNREYFEEKLKSSIDNLNLLYVAATRAENALFICGCPPSEKKRAEGVINNASELLFKIFGDENHRQERADYQIMDLSNHWDEAAGVFEAGVLPVEKTESAFAGNTETLKRLLTRDWRDKISVRFASKELSGGSGPNREKIRYGKLVHRILAQAKTFHDLPRILKEYYYEGYLGREELTGLEEKIEAIFKHPQAREWFSGDYMVKTEASTLQPGGAMRRIDRAMIRGDLAIAVDFKTGARNPADIRQVEDYAELLKEMGYRKVEGYLLYLDDVEIVKVV